MREGEIESAAAEDSLAPDWREAHNAFLLQLEAKSLASWAKPELEM
jgi:hypothetical protein